MSLYSALTQVLAPFAAKIKGIQTGYDGTEYNSPGEAVRGQINDLHVLIGDEPGTAIQASAIAYNGSNVAAELTGVNGRLLELAPRTVIYTAAGPWSESAQYSHGEYVIYNYLLYRCKAALATVGTWTESEWERVTTANGITLANSGFANKYGTTRQYVEGDLVIFNGELYKCTVTASTVGTWVAEEWTRTNIDIELKSFKIKEGAEWG